MSIHLYIFSADLRNLRGDFKAEKSPSKSYNCGHCRIVFVVRSDDRFDGDNVYCDKWVNNLSFLPGTLYMPGVP